MNPLQQHGVEAILDDLVGQFADPLACFRELVQNAIDAGSGEVLVDFEYQPPGEGGLAGQAGDGGTEDRGMAVAEVRDFGEGMDRQLIERRLTRLFSSGKDEDYTKIGRFGIGFVSVFSLQPAAVCVDTGRSGEYWRVLFGPERDYELIALERPLEGTRIRLFLPMEAAEFETFRRRARETIVEWCRHAEIPVLVDGEDIREPFEVDGHCQVTHREEGTRIVAALTRRRNAGYGYYNRGLTLQEGRRGPYEHVSFKIDSRYLEHTLTRDQILEDKNYRKARELLDGLVRRELPGRLLDEMEAAAAGDTRGQQKRQDDGPASMLGTLGWLLLRYSGAYGLPAGAAQRAIVARFGGDPVSLEDCAEAAGEGRLFWAAAGSRLARWYDDSMLVLRVEAARDNGLWRLLSWYLDTPPPALASRWAMPEPAGLEDLAGAAALVDAVEAALADAGARPVWVGLGRFADASPLSDWPLVALEDRREPTPVGAVMAPNQAETPAELATAEVVLNVEHPSIEKLARIAREQPKWAAYMVLKLAGR